MYYIAKTDDRILDPKNSLLNSNIAEYKYAKFIVNQTYISTSGELIMDINLEYSNVS